MDDAQRDGFTMAMKTLGFSGGEHGKYKDEAGAMQTTENFVWSRFGIDRVVGHANQCGVTAKI